MRSLGKKWKPVFPSRGEQRQRYHFMTMDHDSDQQPLRVCEVNRPTRASPHSLSLVIIKSSEMYKIKRHTLVAQGDLTPFSQIHSLLS